MPLQAFVSKVLTAMGFESLTPMQQQTLATATEGKDILLLSPTGTGKTLAFLLPAVAWHREGETTLVIVPGRELACQIADVFARMRTGLRCVCCYGGHDLRTEKEALSRDPHPALIVATPGRIKDHLERGSFDPQSVKHLILDEYDKTLELGFTEEMKAIAEALPAVQSRLLTSATHAMPVANYLGIARFEMLDFLPQEEGKAAQEKASRLTLRQVKSPIADKLDTLRRLLATLPDGESIIVFSNYRESSERIAHYLTEQGINNALYHGGLAQEHRDKALIRFRGCSIRVLISTDLASRGLDIPEVEHVIHYHLPTSEEAYIHRNGRTARAGATGNAYIILGPDEYLPTYVEGEPTYFNLSSSDKKVFAPSPYVTLYIGRGKKEKISKGDVLGFLSQRGEITGAEIGRIDILDHCAYAAVRREVAEKLIEKLRGQKIKGEKTHYLIVTGN